MKKKFLELWQNSEQNTCAKGSLFLQLHQKETPTQVFFVKWLRIHFVQNTSGRLLLDVKSILIV